MDDQSWGICCLVVETGHWFSGKEIVISPKQIDSISCCESKVFVGAIREQFCKHRNTMCRSLVPLRALDGKIGHVKDFCFDAQAADVVSQELKRGSTEPEYLQVPSDHAAMHRAVIEAQSTIGKFIAVLKNLEPGQRDFEIKKAFIQGSQMRGDFMPVTFQWQRPPARALPMFSFVAVSIHKRTVLNLLVGLRMAWCLTALSARLQGY